DQELQQLVARTTAQVAPFVLRKRLHEIAMVDVSEELRKTTVPILYLRGTHDRLGPRSSATRIAQLSDRVTIVDVEAPHMLLQCAPQQCARLIASFARECPGQTP